MAIPSSGPLALTTIQTEFGGTNPIGLNEYYAGGGLVPAGTSGTYGAVPSSGTISVQNFYGTSNFVPVYIEDVFSTWIYAGSNSSQTITNGIDLSTNGGLVWTKVRTTTYGHFLTDTIRGGSKQLSSNNTGASITSSPAEISSFNTTGYTLEGGTVENVAGQNFVGWTFRKQPKFFDIVTYTGDGVTGRNISHNLGAVPGAIIIKNTSSSSNWAFGLATNLNNWSGTSKILCLNTTDQDSAGPTYSNGFINDATSTTFQVVGFSGNQLNVNQSGQTYVAYLFASNAGGFGATGSDNVITCGAFTTVAYNAGLTYNASVTLGFEPQFILAKSTSAVGNWFLADNMRGMPVDSVSANLNANTSSAESSNSQRFSPNATGFQTVQAAFDSSTTYIYIAIRRGPMKVPTVGTSVFTPADSGNDSTATDMNFPIDAFWENNLGGSAYNTSTASRLTGSASMLWTSSNSSANGFFSSLFANTRQNYYAGGLYGGGNSVIQYGFRRAPGFMDVVCYTGTGSATTVTHNLGAVPQWIIVKRRSGTESVFGSGDWFVYSSALGNDYFVALNGSDSKSNSGVWNYTSPTSSVFSVGTFFTNYSGDKYIAYLFATVAGVSKVGSYTGTGAARTIDCGFTTGARFVLIRQTANGGGSWYLWDSARGISSSNDPYILLDSTGAQVSGTNYVDTASVGFQITSAATAADINTLNAPYIFLAIA